LKDFFIKAEIRLKKIIKTETYHSFCEKK